MEKRDYLAQAILYPERIIIVTVNNYKDILYYATDELTILPVNIDEEQLAKVVIKHLDNSKLHANSKEDRKTLRDSFKRKSGFKTEKDYVNNAKYLSIYKNKVEIVIEPFDNRLSEKDKLFYRIPSSIITCTLPCDNALLGSYIREGWSKCLFS